jgi:hypothetical protein
MLVEHAFGRGRVWYNVGTTSDGTHNSRALTSFNSHVARILKL